MHQVEGIDFEETFVPSGQNGSNQNVLGLCMLQKDQGISDGRKINFLNGE
jgi:hypothetical protein